RPNCWCKSGECKLQSTMQTEPRPWVANTSATWAHIQVQPEPDSVPQKTTQRGPWGGRNRFCASLLISSFTSPLSFSTDVDGRVSSAEGATGCARSTSGCTISCILPACIKSSKFLLKGFSSCSFLICSAPPQAAN